jgi:23S rRNA-/tRNA-specific pseudouridylate synthase
VFVLREGEWQRGVCLDQVAEGQGVRVLHRAATLSSTRRSHRLQPVYEDDHMAVVLKLPGMMVHGRGRKTVKHVLGGK